MIPPVTSPFPVGDLLRTLEVIPDPASRKELNVNGGPRYFTTVFGFQSIHIR